MKTVIVVDDDAIFREVTARQLRSLGLDVFTSATSDTLLKQIQTLKPAACIIDMVMPGKEGVETLSEIEANQLEPKPVIIGVSANPHYLNIVKDLLADEVLIKPILPDILSKTLKKFGVTP